MKYLSTYYRTQGGKVTTSLVLQQMQDERLGCSMLFGCLGAHDAMAEELLGWLGRKKQNSWQRNAQTLDEWGREVEEFLERWGRIQNKREDKRAPSTCSVSGILCLGSEFLLFYRGAALFYIINTRFGRNHVKAISLNGTQGIIRGRLESGVGILLPNHNFMKGVTERQLQENLNIQELKVEEQLERRLNELGAFVGEQGDCAAIFLVTQ